MPWADRTPLQKVALDYCAPRGIPLSVFLGRVVGLGQPQWLEDDWRAALDWLAKEANRCSDCGQSIEECTAKENSFAYRAEAVRCHSCWAIAVEAARIASSKPQATAGHRYRVALKEVG